MRPDLANGLVRYPIGPGLLFFFTFWPAPAMRFVGVVRGRADLRQGAMGGDGH